MQLEPTKKIWLPGRGAYDVAAMQISRAVQEYDERLLFGRINEEKHPGYGDWCVFVKMPHGEAPVPVLGFGKDRMPDKEEVLRRCDRANTKKHGEEVLNAINRHNASIRGRQEKAREELSETYVEIMEYLYRGEGRHPAPRVFFPGKGR